MWLLIRAAIQRFFVEFWFFGFGFDFDFELLF